MSSPTFDVALAPVLLASDAPLRWEDITPGTIGLLFVVLLGVATYGLWRSMNTQLKRVDAHFEEEDAADAKDAKDATDVTTVDGAEGAADGSTDPGPADPDVDPSEGPDAPSR